MVDVPAASAGQAPAVVRTMVVALYDVDSGRIRQLHTVQLHEGAKGVDREAAIAEARGYASMFGLNVDALGAAVSDDPNHGSTPHRIEPGSGRFVPLA